MILTGRGWNIFCLNLSVHFPLFRPDEKLLFSSHHRGCRLSAWKTRSLSQPRPVRLRHNGRSGPRSGPRGRSHLYLLRYGSNMLQVAICSECPHHVSRIHTTQNIETNTLTWMNILLKNKSFSPISSSLFNSAFKKKRLHFYHIFLQHFTFYNTIKEVIITHYDKLSS